MKYIDILGFPINTEGLETNVEDAYSHIRNHTGPAYMACANPHSLMVSKTDTAFQVSLKEADILIPDGTGILIAAKILGESINERVAGYEFFTKLSEICNQNEISRVFFLGSSEDVLEKITNKMSLDFPNIQVAGTFSPPYKQCFSEEDNDVMIKKINTSGADVLWVGMTAPKQEKWIKQNIDKLNVQFIGAIGAVFDFYSGNKSRAPEWACDLGVEWLHRFISEPTRLWKRNIISSPLFLFEILKQKFKS